MKAGAVRDDKSPLKDAIDYSSECQTLCHILGRGSHTFRNDVHDPRLEAGTAPPSSSAGILFDVDSHNMWLAVGNTPTLCDM